MFTYQHLLLNVFWFTNDNSSNKQNILPFAFFSALLWFLSDTIKDLFRLGFSATPTVLHCLCQFAQNILLSITLLPHNLCLLTDIYTNNINSATVLALFLPRKGFLGRPGVLELYLAPHLSLTYRVEWLANSLPICCHQLRC